MGNRVNATPTPWAKAWDHGAISRNMYALLVRYGIESHDVRCRMVAHAIVASGWRQACWCYNAWGVRVGSWTGDYYQMNTQEDDGTGKLVDDKGAKWRAFKNWRQAIDDFRQRIAISNPRYKAAALALEAPGSTSDSNYWEALGQGGYYTDTVNMTPAKFANLCNRVRAELAKSTPEQLREAQAFAEKSIDEKAGGLSVPFVVTTIALALLVVVGVSYYLYLNTKGQ